jgi:WXXGXW repeat (2 copies)
MTITRSIRSIRMLLFMLVMLAMPVASSAQIGVVVSFGPPELPVYEQPVCPGERYIWTPGYWAWDNDGDDYYWVPGTWVLAPEVGFLWTPGYWGWGGSGFVFYDGYWGPRVGFYGGINYGFGYFGHGYEGGRWDHDRFFYNREVNNVNVTVVHNVYNTRVDNSYTRVTRVSYNGGNGGINERPTREEETAAHERHISPVRDQVQHAQAARGNTELRASVNHGKPPVAATPRPGAFNDRGVVTAKEGGRYNPPARTENKASVRTDNKVAARTESNSPSRTEAGNAGRSNVTHPKELPPIERRAAPNTGNSRVDQKYQQQQNKLVQRQEQDRQRLQQRQEQEHQRLSQKNADDARRQQTEQRHQQQTQQLTQRHEQQQQKLQQKQQPPPRQNESKQSNKKP